MNPHDLQTRLAFAKPCPFCGKGQGDLTIESRIALEFVCCEACGTEGPIANINLCEDAVTLWNKRAVVLTKT